MSMWQIVILWHKGLPFPLLCLVCSITFLGAILVSMSSLKRTLITVESVSSFFANTFPKWHFSSMKRLFFEGVQTKLCYRWYKCTRCVRTFHSPNRLETLFSSPSRERCSCWIEYQSVRPWHNVLRA